MPSFPSTVKPPCGAGDVEWIDSRLAGEWSQSGVAGLTDHVWVLEEIVHLAN